MLTFSHTIQSKLPQIYNYLYAQFAKMNDALTVLFLFTFNFNWVCK